MDFEKNFEKKFNISWVENDKENSNSKDAKSQKEYEINNVIVERAIENLLGGMTRFEKFFLNTSVLKKRIAHYLKNNFLDIKALGCAVVTISTTILLFGTFGIKTAFLLAFLSFVCCLVWEDRKKGSFSFFGIDINNKEKDKLFDAKILHLFSILMNNKFYESTYSSNENEEIMESVLDKLKEKKLYELENIFNDVLAKNILAYKRDNNEDMKKFKAYEKSLSRKDLETLKCDVIFSAGTGEKFNWNMQGEASRNMQGGTQVSINGSALEDVFLLGVNKEENVFLKSIDKQDCKEGIKFRNSFLLKDMRLQEIRGSMFLLFFCIIGCMFFNFLLLQIANWNKLSSFKNWNFIDTFVIFAVEFLLVMFLLTASKFFRYINGIAFKNFKYVNSFKEKDVLKRKMRDVAIIGTVLNLPSYAAAPLEEKRKVFQYLKGTIITGEMSFNACLFYLDEKLIEYRNIDLYEEPMEVVEEVDVPRTLELSFEEVQQMQKSLLFGTK